MDPKGQGRRDLIRRVAATVAAAWIAGASGGLARAAEPEEIDESRVAPAASEASAPPESEAPPPDASVLVTAALLAGSGFSDRYGPAFGTRIGVLFPMGKPGAFGSGDVFLGGGFVYHSALDGDEAPNPESLEGWSVVFAGEVGYGLHVPLVTLTPYLAGGVVRSSTTSCVEVVCNTSNVADPYFAPGLVVQSNPTSPLAPLFLGVDGRYATSFGDDALASFVLLAAVGLRI